MRTPADSEAGFRAKAFAAFFAALALLAGAQGAAAQTANPPEIAARGEQPTFRTNVNLVPVTVVVRDGRGNAIGNLAKGNFALFDNGKLQTISRFSVETPGGETIRIGGNGPAGAAKMPADPALPDRFVVFLFDDIHLTTGGLANARQALTDYFNHSMRATDRAAIFSTSGRTAVEFTGDREQLKDALNRLQPHPIAMSAPNACPNIDYYLADAIVNKNDQIALNALIIETVKCLGLPLDAPPPLSQPGHPGATSRSWQQAENMVKGTAMQRVDMGDAETNSALRVLAETVRRISEMPGQRIVVLISPGFFTQRMGQRMSEIIERAARENVVVSTLDARGLYTGAADVTKQIIDPTVQEVKDRYDRQALIEQQNVMADLADGTGGTFFHNNNGLSAGIDRLAAAPEYYYLLAFAPRDAKRDGRFHKLRVSLRTGSGWTVQARRGYYAPNDKADPAQAAQQEIHDAVFSREEMRDFPIALHTRFFKTGEFEAKLTVIADVGLRGIRFRKIDGRNANDLTVVSALFDTSGNFVTGNQKVIELRLRDRTLTRLGSGLAVRTTFDVKSGPYVIRVIVRDAGDRLMAAANDTVEIP
ncbi:MAG: VWA domain-containing protein [Bryobacteraceae bacterium]